MNQYLSFEKFITVVWIKIVFWIGVVGILIFGLISMFGAAQMYGAGFGGVLAALFGTALGLLGWRIWCELVILAFRIYEELVAIRKNTTR